MKKIKSILVFSLLLNIAAMAFAVRRLYYMSIDEITPKSYAFYADVRRTILSNLPIYSNDIVFIGDSHTQLFEINEFIPGYAIKNRGINGDNIKGVYSRLGEVINGRPKKLFINIGTNDIGNHETIDSFKYYLNKIIFNTSRASPQTKLFFQSILPTNSKSYEKVKILNKCIYEISTAHKIPYIDLYTSVAIRDKLNQKYDCGDGLHLNYAGYTKWAEILKPYL